MRELSLSEMDQIYKWKVEFFDQNKPLPKAYAESLLDLHNSLYGEGKRAKVLLRKKETVTTDLLRDHYNDLLHMYKRAKTLTMTQTERAAELERLGELSDTKEKQDLIELAQRASSYVEACTAEGPTLSEMSIEQLYDYLDDMPSETLEKYQEQPLELIYTLQVESKRAIQEEINRKCFDDMDEELLSNTSVAKTTRRRGRKNRYNFSEKNRTEVISFINENPDYFQQMLGERKFVATDEVDWGQVSFEENSLLRFARSQQYKQYRGLMFRMRRYLRKRPELSQELRGLFNLSMSHDSYTKEAKVSSVNFSTGLKTILAGKEGKALAFYLFGHIKEHRRAASDYKKWKKENIQERLKKIHETIALQNTVIEELETDGGETLNTMFQFLVSYYGNSTELVANEPMNIDKCIDLVHRFFPGKKVGQLAMSMALDKCGITLVEYKSYEENSDNANRVNEVFSKYFVKHIAEMMGAIYFRFYVTAANKFDANNPEDRKKLQGLYDMIDSSKEALTINYVRSVHEYLAAKLGYRDITLPLEPSPQEVFTEIEKYNHGLDSAGEEKDLDKMKEIKNKMIDLIESHTGVDKSEVDEELSRMQQKYRETMLRILSFKPEQHELFDSMPSKTSRPTIQKLQLLYNRLKNISSLLMEYQQVAGPTGAAFITLQEEYWKTLSAYVYSGVDIVNNNADMGEFKKFIVTGPLTELPKLESAYKEKCRIATKLATHIISQRGLPEAIGIDLNPYDALQQATDIITVVMQIAQNKEPTIDRSILLLAIEHFPELDNEAFICSYCGPEHVRSKRSSVRAR